METELHFINALLFCVIKDHASEINDLNSNCYGEINPYDYKMSLYYPMSLVITGHH